ncbi:hypothetical protein ABKN59_008211 [Abortiporus biennis]
MIACSQMACKLFYSTHLSYFWLHPDFDCGLIASTNINTGIIFVNLCDSTCGRSLKHRVSLSPRRDSYTCRPSLGTLEEKWLDHFGPANDSIILLAGKSRPT